MYPYHMNTHRIIEKLGGPVLVGQMCGISSQAVSQWRLIPVERALQIERNCGGVMDRHTLRPDVFGVAPPR